MTISRKERCPSCGSLAVIKWGRRNGHQRYKCQDCIRTFTFRRKDVSSKNRFVWFRWWVLRKQTLAEISSLSGYSERQLSRWFDVYLEKYPRWEIQRRERVNLLIDGTWFPNKLCLVVYRDESVKATLLYRITDEELEKEICEDLENIRSLGIEVESVTTDGGSGIIKAVRQVFPQAVRQRCLAHIQRECLTWLTRNPKSEAGLELRQIAMTISAIKTNNDRLYWCGMFRDWHERHKEYLNARTTSKVSDSEWYTHKMVRKAYIHLRRALPDMFRFIENPRIPKTTNALESFFGHLKENISIHRGLSFRHYQNYLKWYLYFRNMAQKGK